MKKLFILLFLFPTFIYSQGWEKTYGDLYDDNASSVCQTNDGGFILTGESFDDVFIVKTNVDGDTLWTKRYGNSYFDSGKSIIQTIDGGYIIVGSTSSVGGWDYDVYVLKLNENGNLIWSKTFGGSGFDYGFSVQQSNDGGFLIAGSTYSYGNGGSDFYVIKTDNNGETLWTKTYGGEEDEYCRSIAKTNEGDFVLAGMTDSFSVESYDAYLIKIDNSGEIIWTQTYDGGTRDEANDIQQTSDLGFIITGLTGGNGEEVLLLKINENGEIMWSKAIGGIAGDVGYSVQETLDFGYIITGTTWSYGYGAVDVYLVKTDSNGNELWSKTFGGTDWDGGFCVKQIVDGGYIVSGYTSSFGQGETDVYLIKTDENGNITSTLEIPFSNPKRKLIKTVDILGKEIKPKENIPFIEIYDDGSTEKKIIVK